MVYQHPLAYLLGLEGAALLRAYAGDHDRAFGEARVAEIRRLLDSASLKADGVVAAPVDTVDGYRVWSATYDNPGNGLFPYEEPIVHDIVAALPAGVALDAACGTGRHAEYLAGLGHRVIGVDSSPDMLERARVRVPSGDFRQGDLDRLPLPDDHAGLVVCGLALVHLSDLGPAFAEFARVLRPGGHLVVTDVHRDLVALGSVPHVRLADGSPGLLSAHGHLSSEYLGAALPLGLRLLRCEEPRSPGHARAVRGETADPDDEIPTGEIPAGEVTAGEIAVGPWDGWPWSLHAIVPAATHAAFRGTPTVVVWHFQLD
jgi:SAM-dependent methyltransferase